MQPRDLLHRMCGAVSPWARVSIVAMAGVLTVCTWVLGLLYLPVFFMAPFLSKGGHVSVGLELLGLACMIITLSAPILLLGGVARTLSVRQDQRLQERRQHDVRGAGIQSLRTFAALGKGAGPAIRAIAEGRETALQHPDLPAVRAFLAPTEHGALTWPEGDAAGALTILKLGGLAFDRDDGTDARSYTERATALLPGTPPARR